MKALRDIRVLMLVSGIATLVTWHIIYLCRYFRAAEWFAAQHPAAYYRLWELWRTFLP